ncbi:CinA family protein [Halocalculus aciditolerans]|uniref:Competence damage-inducible protein A n=1 Tax=Halocalculus aciditolerans TaxID=1383812 RepID=A0A830FD09_9EURY|nr:CinA family protein [Halocalculus aciditolerans]GGL63378.1 competence damage-inducible protein A [Halocalculus aciditolerans]
MREYASDPPIEERVGDRLRERGETLATTESCTGGLVGSLLTDVPGSSDYFDRTLVTYTYDAKLDTGVTREALDEHGAVSEPVARQMAQAVRDTADTTWGVSTTGIAGPTGGTAEKPVGTVYIGLAHRGDWGDDDTWTTVSRHEFDGNRVEVKEQIARQALSTLHEAL